ncbi:hypothetical protein [Streptosporangium sp. NPDC051022]
MPLRVEGLSHFTEDQAGVRTAFLEAGLDHLLVSPAPGRPVTLMST